MYFSIIYLLIIFLLLPNFGLTCSSRSVETDDAMYDANEFRNINIKNLDINWLVAVFHVNSVKLDKEYQFKCLGTLVGPDVVIVSSLCAPYSSKSRIIIRHYNWKKSNKTSYVERSALTIYDNFLPNKNNILNVILLTKPFEIVSPIKMNTKLRIDAQSKEDERSFYMRMWRPISCILVTVDKNILHGIKLNFLNLSSVYKPDCCTDSYHSTLPHAMIGRFAPGSFYTITNACNSILKRQTCFSSSEAFCKNTRYTEGPVVCADVNHSIFLYGVMKVNEDCIFRILNTADSNINLNTIF